MINHLSKITIILTAIIMVLLVSCNHNNDKFSIGYGASDHDYGKDIHLIYGDTIERISDPYHPDAIYKCTGKYFYYHKGDSVVERFIQSQTYLYGTIIGEHICDCTRDNTFLLADQQPLDSVLGEYIRFYHEDGSPNYYSRREYDTIGNYTEKRKMIEDSPIHLYWILNTKTADVYGPYSFDDYIRIKKELGVPETLKLKCEKQ